MTEKTTNNPFPAEKFITKMSAGRSDKKGKKEKNSLNYAYKRYIKVRASWGNRACNMLLTINQ